jgi:hypothetical protein
MPVNPLQYISAYQRFVCLSAIAVRQTCLDGQEYCNQADISAYLQYAIHMSVRGEFVYLLYVSLTEVSLSTCGMSVYCGKFDHPFLPVVRLTNLVWYAYLSVVRLTNLVWYAYLSVVCLYNLNMYVYP